MKMQFHVIHGKNYVSAFPPNAAQALHEYTVFPSVLAGYFDSPKIKATSNACIPAERGVMLTVEGNVTAEALVASVEEFILKLSKIQVVGKIAHSHFVATVV